MRQEASIERTPAGIPLGLGEAPMIDAALSSRAFWKELCETIGDMMFETDRNGRFSFLAPTDVLGYPAHILVGHLASDLLCDPLANPFAASTRIRMQHVWFRRADGQPALLALSMRPTPSGGVRGIGVDVTHAESAAHAVASTVGWRSMLERVVSRMREELLTPQILRAGLLEIADCLGAEGAAIVAPRTQNDAPGTEPLLLHGTGEGWDELGAQFRIPPAIASGLERDPVLGTLAGRDLMVCSNRTRFGAPSVLLVWRRDRPGNWRDEERAFISAVADALRDAMEQDSIQREMTQQTRTDVLTGLLTRRSFLAEARRRFDRLDRAREPATLVSIDVDDFRAFDQSHGAEEGDRALCHIAAFLRDTFRPTDLVCRVAADHFAAWLDGADIFAAAERAEWLCRQGAVLCVNGEPVRLGLSIGLASRAAQSLEDLDSLFRRADDAMRQAKLNGKGLWRASQQEIET